MQQSTFGRLGESSAGTLGGSGTGQGWGPTTREEGAATVHEAVGWNHLFRRGPQRR